MTVPLYCRSYIVDKISDQNNVSLINDRNNLGLAPSVIVNELFNANDTTIIDRPQMCFSQLKRLGDANIV